MIYGIYIFKIKIKLKIYFKYIFQYTVTVCVRRAGNTVTIVLYLTTITKSSRRANGAKTVFASLLLTRSKSLKNLQSTFAMQIMQNRVEISLTSNYR
jgi:hypothetical protein